MKNSCPPCSEFATPTTPLPNPGAATASEHAECTWTAWRHLNLSPWAVILLYCVLLCDENYNFFTICSIQRFIFLHHHQLPNVPCFFWICPAKSAYIVATRLWMLWHCVEHDWQLTWQGLALVALICVDLLCMSSFVIRSTRMFDNAHDCIVIFHLFCIYSHYSALETCFY